MESQINDTMPFAALSVGKAREIIEALISEGLERITPKEPEASQADLMNIDDAVRFLQDNGYFIKKNSIYNLTNSKSIPHRKIGRRVIFSRTELLEWVQQKVEKDNSRSDSVLTLAKSANRKR